MLLPRRASSSAAAARAAASTSALAAASSAIASLDAVAAVSAAAHSFLYRGNIGLLPVLRARGDRTLRLSFGHSALVGGCYVGKRLPQTSSSSSVQERRAEQGQPVFLLSAEDRVRRGKGMSRRCLGCMIERL
jgi:hypothetical protein